MSLTVAIIGRPNVGKSTLFNRLVGRKLALVDDQPGVTRDRRYGTGRIGHMSFNVIDTAGLEEAFDDSLEGRMRAQTELAYRDADVVFFLVDVRAGVTPLDAHFADWLRKRDKPTFVLANKYEGKDQDPGLYEVYGLGLGDPVPVSAEHGLGMELLLDALRPFWEADRDQQRQQARAANPDIAPPDDDDAPDPDEHDAIPTRIQLAIVGRPNVGKSTLLNRLLGESRALTGPEAGMTRDSVAVDWQYRDRPIRLVDTAGLRRKKRISERVEKLSTSDTMRVVRYAQVVVLLIDGTGQLDKQDLTIARHVIDEGRALVVAVNKWDAVTDKAAFLSRLNDRLESSLAQIRGIPVVTLSAKTGRGVDKLMPQVLRMFETWNRRVPTAALNRWLEAMTEQHLPPLVDGKRIKLRYMTQAKTRPPSFYINVSREAVLPDAYTRYLVNGLREDFDMPGVPVRVYLRASANPYAGRKKKR